MNNVIPFQFENHSLRVQTDEQGSPWFNANDVCAALEHTNPRKAIADHVDPEDVTKRDTPTAGGVQPVNHLNESGLYALILGSTKPEAKRFKRWVTAEVLPRLRKNGSYTMGEEMPDDLIIAKAFQLTVKKIAVLEAKIEQDKPKVESYDNFMSADGTFTTTQVAKLLSVTSHRLNKFLREQGVKYQHKDLPKKGYEDWFSVKSLTVGDPPIATTSCKITVAGVEKIYNLWVSVYRQDNVIDITERLKEL
jgi:prophage antirepressor-like protein